MSLVKLAVMYGHLEGTAGKFARDPSGYLSLEAGIFEKHGLDVTWNHVQGTEERYRALENGTDQISLVVGRASLQHFLQTRTTKILGCVMNSCPYYLMVAPAIGRLADLKGRLVACREAPARKTPLAQTFKEIGELRIGEDFVLHFTPGDQDAYESLISGNAQAAILPRPFGFWAEEKGFRRFDPWPDIVDDPLPITIETTAALWREREQDCKAFLKAHREGIRHLKSNRTAATKLLTSRFGHSPSFAAKTVDEYFCWMDESLKVEFKQLEKLLAQLEPAMPVGAREIAAEWVAQGSLKE